jgi:hypothetical protein
MLVLGKLSSMGWWLVVRMMMMEDGREGGEG